MITFVLSLIAWAVIPFSDGVVLATSCRHPLSLRISSLGVYASSSPAGPRTSQISVPGRAALGGADGLLRISIGFVMVTCCSVSVRSTSTTCEGAALDLFLYPLLPMFVVFFISSCRDQPAPFDLPKRNPSWLRVISR